MKWNKAVEGPQTIAGKIKEKRRGLNYYQVLVEVAINDQGIRIWVDAPNFDYFDSLKIDQEVKLTMSVILDP